MGIGISIGLIAISPGRHRPGKINDHRAGSARFRRVAKAMADKRESTGTQNPAYSLAA